MASLLSSDSGELRASDDERDTALAALRLRYTEGRISHETFLARVDAVLLARYRKDLDSQLADLPPAEPPPGGVARRAALRLTEWRARLKGAAAALRGGRHDRSACLVLPASTSRRMTIGRDLACDFTLANASVSRWHARLHFEDDRWLLSDMGSTNGTRLNGWRVTTSVPVAVGDRVMFGSVSFLIVARPPADS